MERMDRLKKLMRNEISAILSGDINDPRIRSVTVHEVDISKDLRNAVVLYTVEDPDADVKEVARGLRSAGGYIRGELAERVYLKYMPRITFRYDGRERTDENVGRLFDIIEAERRGSREHTEREHTEEKGE